MADKRQDDHKGIPAGRIHTLNDAGPGDGKYVLYWMQSAQRATFNHALEYAIDLANDADLPLVTCFGLTDDYPEANARHYHFLLEGLRDVGANLKKRDVKFVVGRGNPSDVALKFARDAAEVVTDMGYVRPARQWRDEVAGKLDVRFTQIEGEVVVPVDEASDKQEYAARTLRPKLHKLWDDYLADLPARKIGKSSVALHVKGHFDVSNPDKALDNLKVDKSVAPSPLFDGGEDAARRRLDAFVKARLKGYADGRNEPSDDFHSYMSMYLHYGHVSPVELAITVRDTKQGGKKDRDSYLEELVVRRELSRNFVWHCADYDKYACIPDWAKKTLADHESDDRPHTYTRRQLEAADTHDRYWNAAQKQMVLTGFMHNYMRMYWGKKILEWTKTPRYGHETTLYLNNKYFLDGRDPNSYGNVAWCYGLHDRPWTERKIFGKIRYMNDKGLERKFDINAYVDQIGQLEKELA